MRRPSGEPPARMIDLRSGASRRVATRRVTWRFATYGSRRYTLRDVWEPVGPLPASVYWRRRWVAIASAVSVIVLLFWGIAALAASGPGAPGDTATARPATRAAMSAPQQVSPSPAAPPLPAQQPGAVGATTPGEPTPGEPTTEGAGPEPLATEGQAVERPAAEGPRPGRPATEGQPAEAPEVDPATATAPGSSERLVPDDSPRASSPVPSPAPVPPTGPVPCTNDMLAVTAEVDRPQHRVGERPLLRLVVVNTSEQPCVRDLDPARQEIVVWSSDGSLRLWSSNDCSNVKGRRPAHARARAARGVLGPVGRTHLCTRLPPAAHDSAPGRLPRDEPGRRRDQPADPVRPNSLADRVQHHADVADLGDPHPVGCRCRCPGGRARG